MQSLPLFPRIVSTPALPRTRLLAAPSLMVPEPVMIPASVIAEQLPGLILSAVAVSVLRPALCPATSRQRDDGENESEQRCVERLPQPDKGRARVRDREPQRPADLLRSGTGVVDEVVRISLDDEPAGFLADDPVENTNAELGVAVENDITDVHPPPIAHDDEIAAMELRLHARL